MKRVNQYIEFEVNTRSNPFAMFGGGGSATSEPSQEGSNTTEDGFEIATEDSINELARILGGA